MTLRTITARDFYDEFAPCEDYPLARLEELWQGRELNALDILNLDIPPEDRIWGAIRMVNAKTQRLFACDCAESVLKRERDAGREPDERSWNAVAVARRYAHDEASEEELRVAWDAAWDAAWAEAYAAAEAKSAAYAAATTKTVAWAADRAAADAADAAERKWQVSRLKRLINSVA